MGDLLSFLTLRTIIIFAATTFSILVVMLSLNIVTVDEVAVILNLSPEAANAFKTVISRMQEVTGNILDVASQLLNKLLSWAGVEVDLNKIKIDIDPASSTGSSAASPSSAPANYPVGKDAAPASEYESF
jgi:hypothetical protein